MSTTNESRPTPEVAKDFPDQFFAMISAIDPTREPEAIAIQQVSGSGVELAMAFLQGSANYLAAEHPEEFPEVEQGPEVPISQRIDTPLQVAHKLIFNQAVGLLGGSHTLEFQEKILKALMTPWNRAYEKLTMKPEEVADDQPAEDTMPLI